MLGYGGLNHGQRRISTEDSVLLMSPQVIRAARSILERIQRGEVQGTLTEYSSSAWRVGVW